MKHKKVFLVSLIKTCLIVTFLSLTATLLYISYYHYKYIKVERDNLSYNVSKINQDIEVTINQTLASPEIDTVPTYLTQFINCMNNPTINNFITSELNNKINKLNQTFNYNQNNIAFDYEDLYTGFRLSYNKDQKIYAASVVKAAAAIYAFELIRDNKLDLNKTLTYTPEFYVGSSGLIKYNHFYTTYTIEELLSYAVINSDNIAFAMIKDYLTKDAIRSYWNKLGVSSLFNNSNLFGELSANDGNIYMKEIYKNYIKDDETAKKMINLFINANNHFIATADKEILIAHKYGQYDIYAHDSALVFDNHPYVLTILTTQGENNYQSIIKNISLEINNIHDQYWKELKNTCISLLD